MTSRGKVPDAWDDDDWGTRADQPASPAPPAEPQKLTKAERRAQQAALNKKLWDEAEAPDAPYYVAPRDIVPLQSEIKPQVKLLSRKPAPTVIAKNDPVSGLDKLTIEDDDDDDDEAKPKTLTLEERKIKAAKEREEKQKKYEEVRERLFGSSNPPSGSDSPGNVTPPRGGGRGGRERGGRDSRPSLSSGTKGRQLYDTSFNAKPNPSYVQRQADGNPSTHSKCEDDQITRQPRAPDGSGRGGSGFVNRGRGQRS